MEGRVCFLLFKTGYQRADEGDPNMTSQTILVFVFVELIYYSALLGHAYVSDASEGAPSAQLRRHDANSLTLRFKLGASVP